MQDGEVPTVEKLISVADLSDIPASEGEIDDETVARHVFDYYSENGGMKPQSYRFKSNDGRFKHRADSLIGVPSDEPLVIEEVIKEKRFFSDYNYNTLGEIGINLEERWNGEISDVVYQDRKLKVGKTDYYTVVPFGRLLSLEAQYSNPSNMNLRDSYLKEPTHFYEPARPVSATSGGIILANDGKEWVFVIGRRSEKTDRNTGMLSIFPNGRVEQEDIENDLFSKTLRREFKEELFSNSPKGDVFLDKHIESIHLNTGWNLRDASLTVSYLLTIDSAISYDVLESAYQKNEEIESLQTVPVSDIEQISDITGFDKMSAGAIGTFCEALIQIDQDNSLPELPYEVERIE